MNPDQHVEHHQESLAGVKDTLTGDYTPHLLAAETVFLDPATGGNTYKTLTSHVLTADGRLAKPDATFLCRQCDKTISTTAAKSCTDCCVSLCSACAKTPARCSSCRRYFNLWRFLRWLRTL